MNHGFRWCFTTVIFYISEQLWKDTTNIRVWKGFFRQPMSKRQTFLSHRLPGCGLIAVAGPKSVVGEANEGKLEELCPFWCC